MTEKSYSSELQRVLARSDIDKLRSQLATYYKHSATEWPDEVNQDMDAVMDAYSDDPERGLAYVVLAMAEYEDADFLGLMSAGLLENLLQDPTPDLLDRIATEARKTARMRWMLGIPYRHAISARAWQKIKDYVIQDVDGTPLPPAPFV